MPAICVNCVHHVDDPERRHICKAFPNKPVGIISYVTGERLFVNPSGREVTYEFPGCSGLNNNGNCERFTPDPGR